VAPGARGPAAESLMFKLRSADLLRRLRGSLPLVAGVAVLVVAFSVAAGWRARHAMMERRLQNTPAGEIDQHPDLIRFAASEAKPVFAKECSPCHGKDMKGNIGTGAPNLTDNNWLYGNDLFRIERTILYGIRTGRTKANDIADMRAFGSRGLLTEADISNVVQYVLLLSNRPHDDNAAELGRAVYEGPGLCYDCHAGDAKGNIDYGAPDLTADVWDYGGSPKQLYDSIYYGRHGIMPSWYGKLSLAQIRALAVYVHSTSHK
jgi:cytochrome c oxidase cbb3-type subunit 3